MEEIVHFRWRYEEEFYKDSSFENYDEFSEFDTRNYLALEVRYYPKFLSFENTDIYINCFSKIGERKIRLQDSYPLKENLLVKQFGHFFDLGASLGMEIGNDFGFDFNIGAVFRKENKIKEYYHLNSPISKTDLILDNRWGVNIRTSFYYRF